MGSGSSHSNKKISGSSNEVRPRLETPVKLKPVLPAVVTRETSVQTSVVNLRANLTQEPPSAVRSIITQKTFTQPSEIKLIPDRKRTIGEDEKNNPRKDLLANEKHRQYIDNQCNNVDSIAELVKKIGNYSQNDLIRAWLIFYWITKHIKYVGGHNDNAADVVFRTRTGVCRGFTHLFSECCRLLNIECVDVPGYVKENWFRIGDSLQQATHVWNAVKLSDHWYLLDATWGAGTGNKNKLEEFYFLTSPDQMIYTHLPTEDMWQLLSPCITKQQFLDLPIVKSVYYQLNLKLISPKQCVIETNQSLFEVIIKTPSSDVTLTTSMKVGNDDYPDFHKLCQYDHTDGMTRCYFSPTNDGKTNI
jgi:transglutaminase/protease-like cytokinesis protein 3